MTFESKKYMRQREIERGQERNKVIDSIINILRGRTREDIKYIFNRINYELKTELICRSYDEKPRNE